MISFVFSSIRICAAAALVFKSNTFRIFTFLAPSTPDEAFRFSSQEKSFLFRGASSIDEEDPGLLREKAAERLQQLVLVDYGRHSPTGGAASRAIAPHRSIQALFAFAKEMKPALSRLI
ncbi:MAG: hypothetical protein LBU32_24545 [Clostridiales bacterium]|nr:hypothetical protein [Clostridiales bacterium]